MSIRVFGERLVGATLSKVLPRAAREWRGRRAVRSLQVFDVCDPALAACANPARGVEVHLVLGVGVRERYMNVGCLMA